MNVLKNLSPTSKFVGIVAIAFLILWVISSYLTNSTQENLDYGVFPAKDEIPGQEIVDSVMPQPTNDPIDAAVVPQGWGNSGKDITPLDLLPSSADANVFDSQFPSANAGNDLSSKNFLTAGYSIGINTVSSSLKNANTQVRSDPFIPVKQVSPWGMSTIVPDLNRKQLDIGVSSSC